jgi:hypothetical protein
MIDIHYKNVVNVYNNKCHFLLQSSYEQWVINCLINHFSFQLNSPIRIVDLGCGNGYYINKFVSHIRGLYQVKESIGVDPYIEWLSVAKTQPNITQTMCVNANEFSKMSEMNYSHLLMKEMIHHIDVSRLPDLFNGIYKQLDDNGRVVLITRPVETNYPFFERIHHLWKLTQTPYEVVVSNMKQAGFDVQVKIELLSVNVEKEDWLSFIKNKTWSVFSMCTEEEMLDGLNTLNKKLEDTFTFNETLIFIVGHKI